MQWSDWSSDVCSSDLQINFMAATIAMMKNINLMGIVCTFIESDFFSIISVGMNCRDGSNTFLFTEQQKHQLIRFVLMIWLHDIDYYPISATDYGLFYRL